MFKSIMATMLCVFMCACATSQAYKNKVEMYVGGNIDQVIEDFGLPDNQITSPNGNNVYVYSVLEHSTSPKTCSTDANGVYNCTGGNSSTDWCKTFFEINKENVVIKTSFRGNDCKACAPNDKTCKLLEDPFSWVNQ